MIQEGYVLKMLGADIYIAFDRENWVTTHKANKAYIFIDTLRAQPAIIEFSKNNKNSITTFEFIHVKRFNHVEG